MKTLPYDKEQQIRCARHELRVSTTKKAFYAARERLERAKDGVMVYVITVDDNDKMTYKVY